MSSPDAEQTEVASILKQGLPIVVIWVLLTLPTPLVLLTTYIVSEGQIKLSGVIVIALVVVLIECVVLFLYRCVVVFCRCRRN
jgi:hypothetical protein